MKTIMHPDYWIEIPAGEFLTGLSDDQRKAIVDRILNQVGLEGRPESENELLESASHKLQHYPRVPLTKEERDIFRAQFVPRDKISIIEEALTYVIPQESVQLKQFYIARFPITRHQYYQFTHGTEAIDLPGALEEPETKEIEFLYEKKEIPGRNVAAVKTDEALMLCKGLGGRLPAAVEWEKAARGADGRLYPWGNEWDPGAGFFFYGQQQRQAGSRGGRVVDAFPHGVSSYGVWAMAGGLPELVTVSSPRPVMTRTREMNGQTVYIDIKGCHAKESSKVFAWFDHILAIPGQGFWVSLRPVLDEWPRQQWRGSQSGDEQEEVK